MKRTALSLRMAKGFSHAKVSRKHANGFTLLEILVALLIIAIGLLGIAGLQTKALKRTQISNQETHAIFINQELLNAIRINRADIDKFVVTNYNNDYCTTNPAQTICDPNNATSADAKLLHTFQQIAARVAPDAKLTVKVENIAGTTKKMLTISIAWNERILTKANGKQEVITKEKVQTINTFI